MSEARALAATEKARDLVARPERMGLERRQGLEPLDVQVKFNRAGSHTSAAFQVVVRMKLTWDEGATWSTHAGLVGHGKTEAEALEQFYNWMADPHSTAAFREVVKAHEAEQLDSLAQSEVAKDAAESSRVAARIADNNRNWAERKLDQLGRAVGLVKPKVQA